MEAATSDRVQGRIQPQVDPKLGRRVAFLFANPEGKPFVTVGWDDCGMVIECESPEDADYHVRLFASLVQRRPADQEEGLVGRAGRFVIVVYPGYTEYARLVRREFGL